MTEKAAKSKSSEEVPAAGEKAVPVFLNATTILKADDIEQREVEVAEWGGYVLVRGLTAYERDQLEQSARSGTGTKQRVNLLHWRAKLVSLACIDDRGQKIFQKEHVLALSQKSGKAIGKVLNAAMELSGITEPQVEEADENLEPTLLGGSPSD